MFSRRQRRASSAAVESAADRLPTVTGVPLFRNAMRARDAALLLAGPGGAASGVTSDPGDELDRGGRGHVFEVEERGPPYGGPL